MGNVLNNTIEQTSSTDGEIVVSPKCYAFVNEILNAGTEWMAISRTVELHVLQSLIRRGLLERTGFVKGRYGTRGRVRLVGDYTRIVCGEELGPRRPRTRKAEPPPPVPSGWVQFERALLPLDRSAVARFLDETSSTAQREFEKRKQDGLTDTRVTEAVRGLRGERLIAKLRELEAEYALGFREFLTTKLGFTTELIAILGVPECGPDTPEPMVRR
jgi:hypothetical protein